MKKIIFVFGMSCILGCVTPPQTPQELRAGVKRGAMMTKMEHVDVKRTVNSVFRDIKRNADKCFNVAVTGSTPGTHGSLKQSSKYRARSRMTGRKTGEMVMQMEARASGKMPKGGYYVLLADMAATSRSKTLVTVYGSSVGYDDVFQAIFDWAKGKKRACPKWMR